MENLRAQAERFGAALVTDDVTGMDLAGDVKRVWTGDDRFGGRQEYAARAVILATGSAYRHLGVPGEDELSGHGVSWCATCDGFFFRDQDIAVVGGGDSAVEEATFLSRFAKSVTLVHRRDALRASKIMQARAFADPKLSFAWNSAPVEVVGADGKVCGLKVADTVTGEQRVIDVTGVFVAIGHEPRTELVKGQVDLDDAGYVTVTHPPRRPPCPGSSPAATWSTTPTGRPSPPRVPGAPPPWTLSATSPPSPTRQARARERERRQVPDRAAPPGQRSRPARVPRSRSSGANPGLPFTRERFTRR
jgi:thioredoxin reductase (NADPH)